MSNKISFEELLSLLYNNPKKYKYHQDSPHFTQTQKNLLKAYAAFKAEERDEVFRLLRYKKFDPLFEEGIRCYILALTFNSFGHYKFAKEHFDLAENIFKQIKHKQYQFYCLCELFFLHSNLKTFDEIDHKVKDLEKANAHSEHDQLLKSYALALHYFNTKKENKALRIIDQSLSNQSQKGKMFRNPFLMTLLRIQLRKRQFEECYKTLRKYKEAKGYKITVNYKYIKLLLDFIVKEKPLYVYARDFKENPELFQQLQCIDYLARKQLQDAAMIWSKLQKHNPKLYKSNYQFPSDDSLFSLALKKVHNQAQVPHGFSKDALNGINKTLDKLDYILTYYKSSITKAELIEYLWQEEVDEKSLKKLSRLMMKYKNAKGIEIKSYQETYKIVA